MAPQNSNSPANEFGDLFDYNANMQDVFRDVDVAMDVPNQKQSAVSKSKEDGLGLGLDEEIKITKKRQPIPKLDENRLLSQAGIPKLRRLAKERVNFKGKNHEYSDLARLLNVYQLWLDDLYPRAKFADGLAMIEKLGHSKRIQVMRREWINEGKPRESVGDLDTLRGSPRSMRSSKEPRNNSEIIGDGKITEDPGLRQSSAPSDDDLYAASPPRQQHITGQHSSIKSTGIDLGHDRGDDDGVPEDDLDALLAETDNQKRHSTDCSSIDQQGVTPSKKEEEFDAEMEVMAEMDEMW
ncbi:MAG: hypothetical protein Q9225_006362 [Loekoesia sp. 1 TL-2023]